MGLEVYMLAYCLMTIYGVAVLGRMTKMFHA